MKTMGHEMMRGALRPAWTVARVAKVAGVSRQSVHHWLEEGGMPSSAVRKKLQLAMGIPVTLWDLEVDDGP